MSLSTLESKDCVESEIQIREVWEMEDDAVLKIPSTYLQNRNRVMDVENKLMVPRGEGGKGRDKLGGWDWHLHTTYKIDN